MKKRRKSGYQFLLYIFLIPPLFMLFINVKIVNDYNKGEKATNARMAPPMTVAIVPGASVYRMKPSTILRDRLECAWRLYQAGKVKKILLSGDNGKITYNELKPMLKYMLDKNVKPADLFVDHAGFRTLDTLRRARDVFQVKDAIIVTQEFHQPRAGYISRAIGIKTVSMESDLRIYRKRNWYRFREFFARNLAWIDIHILHTEPKYLGKPYPITGSGIPTWKGSIY